ncbi:CobW family GTP-binding protein [Salinicola peritrichatus]|uniref:CobW family GTP-binding protein n=1 Tax=Salinicola peritrichatus TaxID=1267424 RepID=UPI000DA1E709|nr:GTP-binding protein [Salinicola peritrichatus]
MTPPERPRRGADYTILPVVVLTGFLGSGKTSLLTRLLRDDPPGETALLINEVGDVGIDHQLVSPVAPEARLLPSGCVCCSIRGELKAALLTLYEQRQRGELPPFRRVILETTGLADPAPILATLSHDSQLRHHFRPGRIITVIDALNAELQQRCHPEWLAQVGAADELVVSKDELLDSEIELRALRESLERLNPAAEHHLGRDATPDWLSRFVKGVTAGPMPTLRPAAWNDSLAAAHGEIRNASLVLDSPINWTHFGIWLSMLLRAHGTRLLRIKGLLDVGGAAPVAIHGVQHVLHPPQHLAAWPDDDRRSRLVFITRGIEPAMIERSLMRFMAALSHSDI